MWNELKQLIKNSDDVSYMDMGDYISVDIDDRYDYDENAVNAIEQYLEQHCVSKKYDNAYDVYQLKDVVIKLYYASYED